MGVSAKTAIKQAVNNGRYKKEAWQYREFGSTHGIVLGFFWGGGSPVKEVTLTSLLGSCSLQPDL